MTTEDVLKLIAEALVMDPSELTLKSKATDMPDAWDSMGTMNILLLLNKQGITLKPGEVEHLQSVEGILSVISYAGKLS